MGTGIKIQGGIGQAHYVSKLAMREHHLISDEPLHNGGSNAGPSPTELILSGLAACTLSTLRMYADRKGWAVDRIEVDLSIQNEITDSGQIAHILNHIEITGNVTLEQKERMVEIARKCPIQRLLTNPIAIVSKLSPERAPEAYTG